MIYGSVEVVNLVCCSLTKDMMIGVQCVLMDLMMMLNKQHVHNWDITDTVTTTFTASSLCMLFALVGSLVRPHKVKYMFLIQVFFKN